MADDDTTGFRETANGKGEVARLRFARVDDGLKVPHGRHRVRRSRVRTQFESRHHSSELRDKT